MRIPWEKHVLNRAPHTFWTFVVRVRRLTSPTVATNSHIGKRHAYSHEIYVFSVENTAPFRPRAVACTRPGGEPPPPNIPGKLRPPLDPCPPACEGGVHCCRGSENVHFSAPPELFFTGSTFSWFCQFSLVRAGVFPVSTRPNVPVPRFLRFLRFPPA